MFNILKSFLILSISCCAVTEATAQQTYKLDNKQVLNIFQDSLRRLASKTYTSSNNPERFASNVHFIKTLVNALKEKDSFTYGFDSLKQISIVRSPDNAFRIFSWQVPEDGGTYRFFGAIQMKTSDGNLKLYPLIDGTENFKDLNEISDYKKWYGSRYYEIIPITSSSKPPYYVLLGWKGNNQKTSKKVMDVLSFEKAEPVFGKAVFEGPKSIPVKNRVIFEYNKLNSMTLRLDKNVSMIVFDHLAPFDPSMTGNFEYYGSDSSFDAYKVVGGKLKLVENIELKNDPNALDDFYIDPAIKNTPAPKKF